MADASSAPAADAAAKKSAAKKGGPKKALPAPRFEIKKWNVSLCCLCCGGICLGVGWYWQYCIKYTILQAGVLGLVFNVMIHIHI